MLVSWGCAEKVGWAPLEDVFCGSGFSARLILSVKAGRYPLNLSIFRLFI